jgi:hypothetical protein
MVPAGVELYLRAMAPGYAPTLTRKFVDGGTHSFGLVTDSFVSSYRQACSDEAVAIVVNTFAGLYLPDVTVIAEPSGRVRYTDFDLTPNENATATTDGIAVIDQVAAPENLSVSGTTDNCFSDPATLPLERGYVTTDEMIWYCE